MAIWVTWPAWTKFGTLGVAAGLLTLAAERSELLKNNMFDLENYRASATPSHYLRRA
jgi:hypothetical protein